MTTRWHVPSATLVRFASDPAALDQVTAASVEVHLTACAGCRAVIAQASDVAAIAHSWATLVDVIDRPGRSALERTLARLGVRSTTARLLAATPALRLRSLGVLALLVAGAVGASRQLDAGGPFLVTAPLIPLVATALGFLRVGDPGGEAGLAAPLAGAGLVLRRAAVLLGATFALLGAATVALPTRGTGGALAWVLPALALSLGSLALSTFMSVELAATALGVGWAGGVVLLRIAGGERTGVADLPLFTGPGQATAAVVLGIALGLLVARRDQLTMLEVPR